MAVVMLDDGSAQIEVMLFNEIYERNRTWINVDDLLVVQGRASVDDYSGGMRVSADELYDFASARSAFAKRLELSVDAQQRIRVAQLKELLSSYGGSCQVVINYRNHLGSAPLLLGENWRVSPHDDLLGDLRAKLGEGAVQLVYG
jgi:DNA polymerase III subunit alpha